MRTKTIVCVGVSHKTAPLALREQVYFTQAELDAAATGAFAALTERAVVSTCNRHELYVAAELPSAETQALAQSLLQTLSGLSAESLNAHAITLVNEDAIHHLLRTAAGLESLVLGEPQILGQVTKAYVRGVESHAIGPVLTAVFQSAIRTGKRARTETVISKNPASLSSIAVAQAQALAGNLREKQVLLIGLGEMGQLALKALRARGIEHISVANRTVERAAVAAAPWQGRAYGLDELDSAVAAADVIFCATGAPQIVVNRDLVARSLSDRPKVFLDLAVPRDVDPAVADLPNVELRDVDTLQASLDEALAVRQAAVPQVEAIVAQESAELEVQLRTLTVQPLIADMRRKAEEIRQRELQRTLRQLGDVDEQTLTHIQHLSRSLINKLLHEPTLRLRQQANEGELAYIDTARDLFGLESGEGQLE